MPIEKHRGYNVLSSSSVPGTPPLDTLSRTRMAGPHSTIPLLGTRRLVAAISADFVRLHWGSQESLALGKHMIAFDIRASEKERYTMHGKSDVDTDVFFLPPSPDAQNPRSISAHVQVDLGALSDAGKVRKNNEDHFLVVRLDRSMQTLLTNLPPDHVPQRAGETAYSMLVADGMGGHAAGEVASRNAISFLVDLVLETPDWTMRLDDGGMEKVRQRMERRYQQVQEALIDQAQEDPDLSGMGTTLTVTCSLGADLLLFHAGDSRAYLFRQDRLHRLTCDHTMAQSLADVGAILPEEVATHPLRHILTNALGGRGDKLRVECHELRLADGDQILLCTDGLTDLVPDAAILEVLQWAGPATDTCRALVDLALEAGGKDNVTVALGRYHIPEENC